MKTSSTLGVRVTEGTIPLIGWIYFSESKGETTQAPIDWQHRVGEVAASREEWLKLTQGKELARGKKVRFTPKPEYKLTTDENDPYDLTDGKLSARVDDRIWFDKGAVGWIGTGGGGSAVTAVTLRIDLEKVESVGQIAIRLLAGQEQISLRLPNAIAFYASEDGETWHVLKEMQKLMSAESNLSDFKTAFYIPEEGKAFVYAFTCNEPVKARYIAIRIDPETSLFTDQISIQEAMGATKTLAEYPVRDFFSDGVVAHPRQPEFTIFPEVHVANYVVVDSYQENPYKSLEIKLDFPKEIKVLANDTFNFKYTSEENRNIYQLSVTKPLRNNQISFFLEKEGESPLPSDAEVSITTHVDGVKSHQLNFPIRERNLEVAECPEDLDISLAWMGTKASAAWPNFFNDFHKLGFNFISSFPRMWQNRNSQRDWKEDLKSEGEQFFEKARENGFKIIMNESPFHEMKITAIATRREGKSLPEYEEGFYLHDKNGKETQYPNPFYRGYYYHQEMRRITEATRSAKPDHVYLDIEYFRRGKATAERDPKLIELWKASGKKWSDFVTDSGTEMLKDIQAAIKEGMEGKPMPTIGLYGGYAAQPAPTDSVYEWSKIYPEFIQISMPSLYVQGRTLDVANRIKNDYSIIGKKIIPWLTTGTYGAVRPPTVESMVLESILNGAKGVTYYKYENFDPLHFYYHARAVSILGHFARLLREGTPQPYQGSNPELHYTSYVSQDEALIMVGNYARTSENTVTLTSLFPNAETVEVLGKNKFGKTINTAEWQATIPSDDYVLYYQKRIDTKQ